VTLEERDILSVSATPAKSTKSSSNDLPCLRLGYRLPPPRALNHRMTLPIYAYEESVRGLPCTDRDLHRYVPQTVEMRVAELAHNLSTAIAALSELAGRGDSVFCDAVHLAAVAGVAGRAFEMRDSELRLQGLKDQQAQQ